MSKSKDLFMESKSAWLSCNSKTDKEYIEGLSEGYKDFLYKNKTERLCVNSIVKVLEASGFKNMNNDRKSECLNYYWNCKGKALIAVKMNAFVDDGLNIVASHIDSPRLDLKIKPMYEKNNMCLFKSHYYGGIKYYQWACIPLSIMGVVYTSKGKLDICIGENDKDPKLFISDLAAHTSHEQLMKIGNKIIEPEELNIILGSIPEDKVKENAVKSNILKLLNKKYGMVEEDFISCDLEIVPSHKPFDVGLDSSLIAGYGHDDRSLVCASLEAFLDSKPKERPALIVFVDKEETGSEGDTGMKGRLLENFAEDFLKFFRRDDLTTSKILRNSFAVSADGTAAMDPTFPDINDENNSTYLGHGVFMERYGAGGGKYECNETRAEYANEIVKLFKNNKIPFQVGEMCKLGKGGGGTISMYLSQYGMDAVDVGISMLCLHSPLELISKVDLYCAYKFYKAFFESDIQI